jgi:hypothetical protein
VKAAVPGVTGPGQDVARSVRKLGIALNSKLMSEASTGEGFLSTTLQIRLIVLITALIVGGVLFWRMRSKSLSTRRRNRRAP